MTLLRGPIEKFVLSKIQICSQGGKGRVPSLEECCTGLQQCGFGSGGGATGMAPVRSC